MTGNDKYLLKVFLASGKKINKKMVFPPEHETMESNNQDMGKLTYELRLRNQELEKLWKKWILFML